MNQNVERAFANVRKRFLQRQAALVSKYTLFIEKLTANTASQDHIEETLLHVHRTAGTALAFEFRVLSDQALALEEHLEALSKGEDKEQHRTAILNSFDTYIEEIKALVKEFLDLEL